MDIRFINQTEPLSEELNLPVGITVLVGGGGKTTTMLRLAAELSKKNKVIVGTTTHIWPPDGIPLLENPTEQDLQKALSKQNLVCAGTLEQNTGKLTACSIAPARLCTYAAYVLLEADGAKGMPLKAPHEREPAIPDETAMVLAVAGLDGLYKPVVEAAFRSPLYADILHVDQSHAVTPADAARVLLSDLGQHKGVRGHMRFAIILNKADTSARIRAAKELAALVMPDLAEQVLVTMNRHDPD